MTSNRGIQSVAFSGHESFPLRFAWLTKVVRHLQDDPKLFGREDATVRLGVGKNMVRSMRHWALRSAVVEPVGPSRRGGEYAPTEFGRRVFGEEGLDPFIEDPATAWLLHWQLCSEPKRECEAMRAPTTWYWVFNELREDTFDLRELAEQLLRFAQRVGAKRSPSKNTIQRDVACLVRSYMPSKPDKRHSQEETYDSPLTELSLLHRERETERIALDRGRRPTLSGAVFAYAALRFWNRTSPKAETLSFEQVAYQPTGPGQVFRLTENACVELLEQLAEQTQGALRFGSTAGIRQVLRGQDAPPPIELLETAYLASQG